METQTPSHLNLVILIVTVAASFPGTLGRLEAGTNVNNTTGINPPINSKIDTGSNNNSSSNSSQCYLRSLEPLLYRRVRDMLSLKVKLIEYDLVFPNHSRNPLLSPDNRWSYDPTAWARVSRQHGQTLLSLAFNYGLLSLMTLTLGTERLRAPLTDVPRGCLTELGEDARIEAVVQLLMRDFRDYEPAAGSEASQISLVEDERVCHEVVKVEDGGWGRFTDRCCRIDRITEQFTCDTDLPNVWLQILYSMLASVRFLLLFFGPLLIMPGVMSLAKQTVPYIVKLKTPLVKTIYLVSGGTPNIPFKKVLDLRNMKRFPKFKSASKDLPVGEKIKVKIDEYNLLINYKKLQIENDVNVGLTHSILRNLLQCKIKHVGPFKKCCHTNMCRSLNTEVRCLWISLCKNVARAFVIMVLIPLPYYIRLFIYYNYEYEEIIGRNAMLDALGLRHTYDGALLNYFGPTHPLFISIYCIYFFTVLVLAVMPKKGKGRLRRIAVGAFQDLQRMDWVLGVKLCISNIVWPFERFGIIGCVLAPFYWVVVIPISVTVCTLYCLPSINLTLRFLFYTSRPGAVLGSVKDKIKKGDYRIQKTKDETLNVIEAGNFMDKMNKAADGADAEVDDDDGFRKREQKKLNKRKFMFHLFATLLCIVTMFAVLFILSECVGLFVEIAVFTMMGLIVNAGSVLKVCILIILTVMYSYDCYNNVQKKYLKLNKALFGEVKGRIKDLHTVTGLPSYLQVTANKMVQENRGFKSQELDEQGEYEEPDDVTERPPLNWKVNDLVMFIDSEDTPRVPQALFEQVCDIQVAGAPGPVYRSLLAATREFLIIVLFLLFVFVVVMSFGSVYQVSTTNQVMATMAGGFLPFLMKTFLNPSKPDIEIGTVSFKSKLDEIIKNFNQNWPIFDFPFSVWTEEDERAAREKEEEKEDAETKDSDHEACGGEKADKTVQTEPMLCDTKSNGLCPAFSKLDYVNVNMNNNGVGNAREKGDIESDPAAVRGSAYSGDEEAAAVDLLIYLPREHGPPGWLDEWSDIADYGQQLPHDDDLPVDQEELEMMEDLAEDDEEGASPMG